MSLPADLDPFQVAQVFWSLPVSARTYRKLAHLLGVPNPSKAVLNRLGRMIHRWEEKGHVQHIVLPGSVSRTVLLPRDQELEDQIRHCFGLRGAVVVDVSSIEPPGEPQAEFKAWLTYDDLIHKHLGCWAKRILMGLLRPSDILGTGSGRGPYYTARDCLIPPSGLRYPQQVVSLTGQMTTRLWAENDGREDDAAPRSLDADAIASLLSYVLGTTAQPRRLDRSILQKQGTPPLRTEDVTIALIGIGALAGKHRLVRHGDGEDLRAIAGRLERFNRLVCSLDPPAHGRGPFHHWVGDVCNRLFVVERLDGQKPLANADRKRLEKEVRSLNRTFLNTSPEALEKICRRGAVLAVAGGPHKAAAIGHVLWKGKTSPWISHLVTDQVVARHVLRAGA